MADEIEDVPTQRGTSGGEIGQNPVEIRDKQSFPDGSVKNKPGDSDAKYEPESDPTSGIEP